ncbi:MAG: PilZ domain-containing protein [Myxococcaceae bacterium]|nr:PilZ domain-containing protein [Myxococcaceae bacterium]
MKGDDRRSNIDRRHLNLVPEPLERYRERRVGEERRTSARAPLRLWVVDPGESGVPTVYDGEVSLGGASWWTRYPPLAAEVDIHFRLPEGFETKARARVLSVLDDGDDHRVQVKFTDLPVKVELALARYLEHRVNVAKLPAGELLPEVQAP